MCTSALQNHYCTTTPHKWCRKKMTGNRKRSSDDHDEENEDPNKRKDRTGRRKERDEKQSQREGENPNTRQCEVGFDMPSNLDGETNNQSRGQEQGSTIQGGNEGDLNQPNQDLQREHQEQPHQGHHNLMDNSRSHSPSQDAGSYAADHHSPFRGGDRAQHCSPSRGGNTGSRCRHGHDWHQCDHQAEHHSPFSGGDYAQYCSPFRGGFDKLQQ